MLEMYDLQMPMKEIAAAVNLSVISVKKTIRNLLDETGRTEKWPWDDPLLDWHSDNVPVYPIDADNWVCVWGWIDTNTWTFSPFDEKRVELDPNIAACIPRQMSLSEERAVFNTRRREIMNRYKRQLGRI